MKKIEFNETIYEKNLPPFIEKDLNNLKEASKKTPRPLYYDCLINELAGSVNSAYWDGIISKEQCDYFFKKYIYDESEE